MTKPTPPALVPPAEVATTPPSTPVAAPTGSSAPTLAPSTGSVQAKGTASTRTVAHVNMAQCEKPAYPSTSKRMEEEGSVHLRFLVGIDGKVIQSEIEKSSGFKRLDEAARAGLSKCQFRPAMVDGKPEQSWAAITYIWRLE